MKLDMDARYRVKDWPGVAVWIDGWVQRWEPTLCHVISEDGDEYWEEDEYGEGEWIDDVESGQVRVVMVGDDHRHTIDVDDLILLDELDYCTECGQVGCCHDGRDRTEDDQ